MIYSNLTEASFKFYKDKLKVIEANIETFCMANGFYIYRERYYDESLAINLNTKDDLKLQGNICLQYIDEVGSVKFAFGLIKSCDIGKFRHWRKKTILTECGIEYFEHNAISLLTQAFAEHNAIKIEDLTSRIELPRR